MRSTTRLEFVIIEVMLLAFILSFNIAAYASSKYHNSSESSSNSTGSQPNYLRSSGVLSSSSSHSGHTKIAPAVNVTKNVIDCFENNASNIENQFITEIIQNLGNLSTMQNGTPFNKNHTESLALNQALVDCFAAANNLHANVTLLHGTTKPTQQTRPGIGIFITPGELTVTGVKHPPTKHSSAYNIGYRLGMVDGRIGGSGLPNGLGACNSRTGINGTAATNQCLEGYFAAWDKYCQTSKNECNS